ncbi:hypothetical protein C2E23DRAFT_720354 [Lenzites betulinus]|nr:hypothetical protein C2E23DRAFT_720354 [Lenzites betulinus]
MQNKALRLQVRRAQHQKARAVEVAESATQAATSLEKPTLVIKAKGVIPDTTRTLIRDMIALGLKVDQVTGVMNAVAQASGVTVEGEVSNRSIRRITLEGLVASRCQIAWESLNADGITLSCDGTTIKNINYDSRYLHANTGTSHQRRFLGISSAPNHTSDTQLHGWKTHTQEIFDTYNESPRGLENPLDIRSFLQKVHGMLTDHAEDQKRLKKLFEEWRHCTDRELRGERAMAEIAPLDLLPILAEEAAAAVERAGGAESWAQLTAEELEDVNLGIRQAVISRLGEATYQSLPQSERQLADLFIHAGCCMHKELNSVKGGNTRMMFWAKTGVQSPCLLMNRDNDAAAQTGSSVARAKAEERSSGGAVKLAELAGALFRHKDDKRGQQDATRYFFEATLGFQFSFPDTSNTRYQSYCEAAGELLVHLQLYRNFLEIVRDKKETASANHLTSNVWKGLHDVPTITELCALALYSQSISHPYMREVRGPQDGLTNHLDLGPLHDRLKAHMACVVADPSILLAPDATYVKGSLDGKPWERPEVFATVHELAPNLPHLREVVVEFFAGAAETWERFTAEYASTGTIAKLSTVLRDRAWMPSTNDENEGALGILRLSARSSPTKSLHQHNAQVMYRLNDTSTYIATWASPEEQRFYRQKAREIDSGGLERKRRADIAADNERTAKKKRDERKAKADKKTERRARLARDITPISDLTKLTLARTTVKLIDEQLDWHREFFDSGPKDTKKIPMKKLLTNKELKLHALIAAVERYNAAGRPEVRIDAEEGLFENEVDDGGYNSDE